jgi:hypothetical protein
MHCSTLTAGSNREELDMTAPKKTTIERYVERQQELTALAQKAQERAKRRNRRLFRLSVVAVVLSIVVIANAHAAEKYLYLEVGLGHNLGFDSLGSESLQGQEIATIEAGRNFGKGWGLNFLHLSNPTARDYGINLFRVVKRFEW